MNPEDALAGLILHSPEKIADIWGVVRLDDFEDPRAAEVMKLAHEHFSQNKQFDAVVATNLHPEHALYYAEIIGLPFGNHKAYAEIISNQGRLRRIRRAIQFVMDSTTYADDALEKLAEVQAQESSHDGKNPKIDEVVKRTQAIIRENMKHKSLHGVSTGFMFLDEIYCRYVPGHTWLITGFTNVGKTAFLTEQVQRIKDRRCVIISTEMTEEQMVARIVAHETGMHNQKLLSGLFEDDKQKLQAAHAMERIAERSLYICDDIYDISKIESFVRQRAMQGGVDVVFVDYVQMVTIPGVPIKDQGEELARRFQRLAKANKTCVVCFSQVSNAVGRGEINQLEAKGSGAWAAVADVGVRLKRSTDPNKQETLLFEMQKGRHTSTTTKELAFRDRYTRIVEVI